MLEGCKAVSFTNSRSSDLLRVHRQGLALRVQQLSTAWVKLPNTIIEQGSLLLASATSRHTAVSVPAVVVAMALLRTCCAEAQGRSGQYLTRAGEILSEDDRSKMFAALRVSVLNSIRFCESSGKSLLISLQYVAITGARIF